MNLMLIKNKTSLLENKAKEILKNLKNKNFSTETEMFSYFFASLQNFYANLGKPTMQLRPANGAPMSADYNQCLHEISADTSSMLTESNALVKALSDLYEQVTLDRSSLNNQLKSLEDKLSIINLKLNQKIHEVNFRDSFINQKTYDTDMVTATPAKLHIGVGILTLNTIEASEITNATIRILDKSNGYPGDTHQVRNLSGKTKFYGEDNLHINLAEILDGNSDTWFEYELFNISDTVRSSISSYGLTYNEGQSWAKNDSTPMTLALEIELPIAKTLNFLSLSPYLPSQKGVIPSYIKSIVVSDGKGITKELVNNDRFNEDKVYMFGQMKTKKILITLEQSISYLTQVGHFFFKELPIASMNYLEKDKPQDGKRVDGPKPSITNLGFMYDPSTRNLIQPEVTNDYTVGNTNQIINNLFTLPEVQDIQVGLETVDAWRYQIGLRETLGANYRFNQESDYVSTSFTYTNPITSIQLLVKDEVPKEFPTGNWINYFISVDEGNNWHAIAPSNRSSSDVTTYILNANMPEDGRMDYSGYIDTKDPVTSVRLKISLSRPTDIIDADYYSPIVYNYELKCTVESGVN